MKFLLYSVLISTAVIISAFGQDRTEERKWTIDPETGDTIYTEAVTIARTEDITPRNSMIIINPLKFLLFYNISYYQKIGEKSAIGIGLQIPTISGISGIGINIENRLYPKGKNLRGFYFAPNVSYNNLSAKGSSSSVSIFSIGGLVGWQWFPGDEFALGLGIGIDYYFFSGTSHVFNDYNGTAPALRFDIGYAW